MEPNAAQREDLKERLEDIVRRRYGGKKIGAYKDADVNPATWARAEQGLTIKPASLVAIVRTMWPETGGDWRKIDPPLRGDRMTDEERLALLKTMDISPEGEAEILAVFAREKKRKRREEGTA
jgi:hypothetical protein